MPNGNLELASQVMRHFGNAGEYGVTVFVPWDGASQPPPPEAGCFLVHSGKKYPMPLSEVLATYKVAKSGVEAFERMQPRTGFRIQIDPLSPQEQVDLLYEMRGNWTLVPIDERPGRSS